MGTPIEWHSTSEDVEDGSTSPIKVTKWIRRKWAEPWRTNWKQARDPLLHGAAVRCPQAVCEIMGIDLPVLTRPQSWGELGKLARPGWSHKA